MASPWNCHCTFRHDGFIVEYSPKMQQNTHAENNLPHEPVRGKFPALTLTFPDIEKPKEKVDEFQEWMIGHIKSFVLLKIPEEDIAERLGISLQTLRNEEKENPEVREALKGDGYTDSAIAYALYLDTTRDKNPDSKRFWEENKDWLKGLLKTHELRVLLQKSRERKAEAQGAKSG